MMTDEQIVSKYLMAKESDRKQRIVELADENHCNVQTIRDILVANGVTNLPKKQGRLPQKKEVDPLEEKIRTECEFKPFATLSIFDQSMVNMLISLNEQAKQLQEEIKQKQKMLDAIENAYAALKELDTLQKGGLNE